jgi:hypothetical protein
VDSPRTAAAGVERSRRRIQADGSHQINPVGTGKMPKTKYKDRPEIVDQYLALDKQEKAAKSGKQAMRAKLEEILQFTNFKDIRRLDVRKSFVNEEKAVKWLRRQLCRGRISKDIFNSMFVRMFDPNEFVKYIRSSRIARKQLPKGIYGQKKEVQIRVFQDRK